MGRNRMACMNPAPGWNVSRTTTACFGNGYECLDPGVGCICDSGWSSLSDMTHTNVGPLSESCLINYRGVRIMSYICIIVTSLCCLLIIWHYISLAMHKKSIHVITREYKTLFPLGFFSMGLFAAVFAVLKVSYPDGSQPLVGQDFSISFILFIITNSFFGGVVLYLHVILQFLKSYSLLMPVERGDKVFKTTQTYRISFLVCFSSCFGCFSIAFNSDSLSN